MVFWVYSGLSEVLSWSQSILAKASLFFFNLKVHDKRFQNTLWVGGLPWQLLISFIPQRKSSFWKLLRLKFRSPYHLSFLSSPPCPVWSTFYPLLFSQDSFLFACSSNSNKICCHCLSDLVLYVSIKPKKWGWTMHHTDSQEREG